MTSKIGLFSYLRQAGTVHLHERKELPEELYDQLVSAQKMIKVHLKKSDLRVDIYDSTNAPKDKFVYMREPGNVYVEVTDLLKGETNAEEFWSKKESDEPFLRRIFRFIDRATGCDDPMQEFRNTTRRKYNRYLMKKQQEQAANETEVLHRELNRSEVQVPQRELNKNETEVLHRELNRSETQVPHRELKRNIIQVPHYNLGINPQRASLQERKKIAV